MPAISRVEHEIYISEMWRQKFRPPLQSEREARLGYTRACLKINSKDLGLTVVIQPRLPTPELTAQIRHFLGLAKTLDTTSTAPTCAPGF